MSLSRIPAISFQLTLFHFSLKSAGIFLVAYPIISKLLIIARFKVSSLRKLSNENSGSITDIMYRHSTCICFRYSKGFLDILDFV